MNNYLLVSEDGGKTFIAQAEKNKHVDNHTIAFKKNDPEYLLVGCDGGLYESFDHTQSWKYVSNLPLTQFYKIAVDDALPFYNVFGGTQDNNTQGGPSQTDNNNGIRNDDWFVVLGGDGHQPATEPGNPSIVYAQWQQGNLTRHDRLSGENVFIKPQARLGEKTERFNWDAPVLVSPHKSSRLYFCSQRVWKSENRGDSWEPISEDLTTNTPRTSTPFFNEKQGWDNAWDIYAMSNYSTITSISESPLKEGLIYIGTDDGHVQYTENGGKNWNKIDFERFPGLPNTAFVNDIKTDLFNEKIVYIAFDNHKFGDYNPYLYKSVDGGKSWKKTVEGIDDRTLVWRFVQDHKNKDLVFLGTEFGVYMSIDQGGHWLKFNAGLPTISVRDLAIQKRENDLVLGTFGRGIYILDDYSALRELTPALLELQGHLFTPKTGRWFMQKTKLGDRKKASQGDAYFVADNPEFGIEFTYYLKEKALSLKEIREKKEGELKKDGKSIEFPSWSTLEAEKSETPPQIILSIYDSDNALVRRIEASNKSGISKITWNYRMNPIKKIAENNMNRKEGPLVGPGQYSAKLFLFKNGEYTPLGEAAQFEIKPIEGHKTALPAQPFESVVDFWLELEESYTDIQLLNSDLKKTLTKTELYKNAAHRLNTLNNDLSKEIESIRIDLEALNLKLNGSKVRDEIGELDEYPSVYSYLGVVSSGVSNSTYGPTSLHRECLNNAKQLMATGTKDLTELQAKLDQVKTKLIASGIEVIEP